MKNFKVFSYNPNSTGAKLVAKQLAELSGKNVPIVDQDYVIRDNDWIVTWGVGYTSLKNGAEKPNSTLVLNPERVIARCVEKVDFFRRMNKFNVPVVEWTEEEHIAKNWYNDGHIVYCRGHTGGMDGSGIVVAEKEVRKPLEHSRLYTKCFPSSTEYRIHVFRTKAIFGIAKRPIEKDYNRYVRTSSGGWGYRRDVGPIPDIVNRIAVQCSKALDLDYGGIDILYNDRNNSARLLEANSAPEMGPTSSRLYAENIVELSQGR